MAIESFDDLMQQLEAHPEWRARLQKVVLTDQLLALPDTVAELAERTGQLAERMDQLAERTGQLAERTGQLAERTGQLAERMDQLAERMDQLAVSVQVLADRVSGLAEQLSKVSTRLDGVVGYVTERRYIDKAGAYFGRIARRIHVLTSVELDDLLEPAVAAGVLDERLALEVRLADAVIRGRRDDVEVLLVLEASYVVDEDDVRRASQRAKLLAQTGRRTIPVVAGDHVIPAAALDARTGGVWQVTDGRVEAPDAA